MKIGVVGKGGVGKTTVAGIVARSLAARGKRVVALDCDANPNLAIALGLPPAAAEQLAGIRQALDAQQVEHAPSIDELLARFGADAPGGIRLAVVTRIDRPNPG